VIYDYTTSETLTDGTTIVYYWSKYLTAPVYTEWIYRDRVLAN
jgi:hypothetical protein